MNVVQRRTKEFGEFMRFVTPVLVGIALFVLSDIRGSVSTINNAVSSMTPRVAVLEAQVKALQETATKR